MNGLESIPSAEQLLSAYNLLQSESFSESDIALWSQWSRLDPRLGELLVANLASQWRRLNAVVLNEQIRAQPWPATLGVLLEQAEILLAEQGLAEDRLGHFVLWCECAMADVNPVDYQQYFIGVHAFAGRQMIKNSEASAKPYLRWGFLGRDILINKYHSRTRTLLTRAQRFAALERLCLERESFTVHEYRATLENLISLRQAQRDLAEHQGLRRRGFTRGRRYVVK